MTKEQKLKNYKALLRKLNNKKVETETDKKRERQEKSDEAMFLYSHK